jgi:hypothetical protein
MYITALAVGTPIIVYASMRAGNEGPVGVCEAIAEPVTASNAETTAVDGVTVRTCGFVVLGRGNAARLLYVVVALLLVSFVDPDRLLILPSASRSTFSMSIARTPP